MEGQFLIHDPFTIIKKKKKKSTNDTRGSQAVTHPSTNRA